MENNMNTIHKLTQVLQARRDASPEESYVSSLYAQGLDKILKKIAEESGETIEAATTSTGDQRDPHLIHEVADLWFHTLVLLVHLNQDPAWVLEELEDRFGISGHTEKASRSGPKGG